MRIVISLLLLFSTNLVAYGQQDTVFIKYNKDWTKDQINYQTDTVVFPSGMRRHMLFGTTILPSTKTQIFALNYGLSLSTVSKSNCQSPDESFYSKADEINTITSTDSTILINLNIYDNCCYDFLCDFSVDSLGVLNLIYYGYGTYCSCSCCFGLIYEFKKHQYHNDQKDIIAVMINDDRRTLKKIK